MLDNMPLHKVLFINLILGVLWHTAMLIWCIARNETAFSPDKKMYRPHRWERNGKFYADVLKINRWKDHLPQYIGKNGFSKEHLETVSLDYVDRFITETCRGEWNHVMNCTLVFVLFILNPFTLALILSLLLLLGNTPFIIIQRYNRFRLQKLRKLILKKTNRRQPAAAVPVPENAEGYQN